MKRLDPLTPDRLVLPGRTALERVAQNGGALGQLQLEPVLALQLIRPDHSERTHGTGAIELFPEHEPGVVQTVRTAGEQERSASARSDRNPRSVRRPAL